jgi:hypothetical protein
MIRISRDSSYYDKLRKYQIFIDNIYRYDIIDGETKEIDITSGQHTIYIKIDWCKSNELNFSYDNDNNIMEIECGNSIKGWKRLILLIYICFFKNKYLFIKLK